jgi:hypothetical protein
MPYTIKKFNGQGLATIQDGTVDTLTTNLQLPGKNYSGYGLSLNQSLIYLLENFANAVEPSKKITGQLWFDTSVKKIKVYNGIDFKPLSSTNWRFLVQYYHWTIIHIRWHCSQINWTTTYKS